MAIQQERKIVLIRRKTRLEELIARYNTVSQAQFHIEHMGADFSDYRREDDTYREALLLASRLLETLGRVQVVDRTFVPNFLFGPEDIVVALGQDGLVANTLKYLDGQPLIGVNPDPLRWDGQLLPFAVKDLALVTRDVLHGRRAVKPITLAQASLNDGQILYGVNDLFIGRSTHVSARYALEWEGRSEVQSSSGIIVSTGLGATGWLRSVLAGAQGVMEGLNPAPGLSPEVPRTQNRRNPLATGSSTRNENAQASLPADFTRDARALWYSVREPFPSRTTGVSLVFGRINENRPLTVVSHMPEGGVIFSDGMEADFLQFTSGLTVTIGVAERVGQLVV